MEGTCTALVVEEEEGKGSLAVVLIMESFSDEGLGGVREEEKEEEEVGKEDSLLFLETN